MGSLYQQLLNLHSQMPMQLVSCLKYLFISKRFYSFNFIKGKTAFVKDTLKNCLQTTNSTNGDILL